MIVDLQSLVFDAKPLDGGPHLRLRLLTLVDEVLEAVEKHRKLILHIFVLGRQLLHFHGEDLSFLLHLIYSLLHI